LVNISSGIIASDSFKQDIMSARSIGQVAADKFCTDRIVNGGDVDFHIPLKVQKLKKHYLLMVVVRS